MTNPYLRQNQNVEKNLNNANENISANSMVNNIIPNFSTRNFIQGALIGAVGAYILTNENAQQAIFKSIVKVGKLFEAGTEEIKERFEDAKAEIEAGE